MMMRELVSECMANGQRESHMFRAQNDHNTSRCHCSVSSQKHCIIESLGTDLLLILGGVCKVYSSEFREAREPVHRIILSLSHDSLVLYISMALMLVNESCSCDVRRGSLLVVCQAPSAINLINNENLLVVSSLVSRSKSKL